MKCLIPAAGHGSRLQVLSDSKPLTPVGGVALIEHVVAAVAAAGVRDFVVVTGHQAERVEAFLAALAPRLGVAVAWVRLSDWRRSNGHSVAAGAARIDGDYLLAMADHLFDPEIARMLLRRRSPAGVTLAVDRDLDSPLLDLDDATRVEVGARGEIVAIGKGLRRFNAIDTGLFLATPALADAIRAEVEAGGGGSLSEGVQRLADRGDAMTIEIGGRRWIDVDDPRSLALAAATIGAAPVRDNAA